MSRRSSHGARPHGQRPHRREPGRADGPGRPPTVRADVPRRPASATVAEAAVGPFSEVAADASAPTGADTPADARVEVPADARADGPTDTRADGLTDARAEVSSSAVPAFPVDIAAPPAGRSTGDRGPGDRGPGDRGPVGCTTAQLRRFIKSRAYVPMHELRRRFAIDGTEDDVHPIDTDVARIFVGLPPREGQMLGDLVRSGEIGYELSLDPVSPVVIGVYPMRPVTRN